jgi:hypothetical protein
MRRKDLETDGDVTKKGAETRRNALEIGFLNNISR